VNVEHNILETTSRVVKAFSQKCVFQHKNIMPCVSKKFGSGSPKNSKKHYKVSRRFLNCNRCVFLLQGKIVTISSFTQSIQSEFWRMTSNHESKTPSKEEKEQPSTNYHQTATLQQVSHVCCVLSTISATLIHWTLGFQLCRDIWCFLYDHRCGRVLYLRSFYPCIQLLVWQNDRYTE